MHNKDTEAEYITLFNATIIYFFMLIHLNFISSPTVAIIRHLRSSY